MNARPPAGLTGELKLQVGAEHVIDFASDGMPAVFSTPKMIALIERTARQSLEPFLEPGEQSVGAALDIRHLAPTPLGAAVTIITRVVSTAGSIVSFAVEVRDAEEMLARGLHQRAVIRVDRFARAVARKVARLGRAETSARSAG
jgi:fluoroacetyl-CoA thioesterase